MSVDAAAWEALKESFLDALGEIRRLREEAKEEALVSAENRTPWPRVPAADAFPADEETYAHLLALQFPAAAPPETSPKKAGSPPEITIAGHPDESVSPRSLSHEKEVTHADKEVQAGAALPKSQTELQEELSIVKAVMLMNDVKVKVDLKRDGEQNKETTLRGDPEMLKALMTLKQKVELMRRVHLLLRGDVLYLAQEMRASRQWMLQSFQAAMEHQMQEHNSLQTRLDRLSKVLN